VSYLDAQVGRVVDALDALGLAESTVVLFAADNGTPAPVDVEWRGVKRRGLKGTLSEGGTRVPLIARWKGTTAAGATVPDLVDLSDFLPTLADLAGASVPDAWQVDGRSFAPRLRGTGEGPREWTFSQLKEARCVREARWKLYGDGRLFDIVADPHEQHPVRRGEHPEETARLQKVLDQLR
jgi:arylsulfatase A